MVSEAADQAQHADAEQSVSGWRRVERVFLRPLFLFTCFVLILLAVVQGTGRFALGTAELFVDEINAVAQPFGVQVEGLKGGWSGLNPVVVVDKIGFAGGYAHDVEFELDLLESAYRSAFVPRRVIVGEIFLDLVQTDSGWQLRGAAQDGELPDLMPTIRNVDELEVGVKVSMVDRRGERANLEAELNTRNTSGQHFVDANIRTNEADGLQIDFWAEDATLSGRQTSRRLSVAGRLDLPEILVRQADASITDIAITWREDGETGSGSAALRVDGAIIPGEKTPLELAVESALTREADILRGDVSTFLLSMQQVHDAERVDLSGLQVYYSLDALEEMPELRLWHPGLDLAQITQFGTASMDPINAGGRWIRGLQAEGKLNNLHLFVELASERIQFGYAGSLADLTLQGFRGAPGVTKGQGQIWGDGLANAVQLNASDGELNFPDLFTDTWSYAYLQGVVKAWVAPGYFAMRGESLKAQINGSNIAGSFSLTRPDPRYEQRTGLRLQVDQSDLMAARTFIPYKIPDDLARWLDEGPQGGQLSDITFLYQGQVHMREGELGRRIELKADIENGKVRYDQEWPVVTELAGEVHVAGTSTRVQVAEAESMGMNMVRSSIELVDNGAYANVALNTRGPGENVLSFILNSPLNETLGFVTPAWEGSGRMDISGNLLVPIKEAEAPDLAVAFDFDVIDLSLVMPEYRTAVSSLSGNGRFELPHMVTGSFSGEMFDHPTRFLVSSDEEWVRFAIDGAVGHPDVYSLIDYEDIGIVDGQFEYDGVLSIALNDKKVTNLSVASEMVGLEIRLPSYLAKSPDDASTTEIDVQFLDDYQVIRWAYKDTQGWLHYGDEIERGAIGVASAPPTTTQAQQAIAIGGSMARLVLSEWVSDDGEAQVALPLDWRIKGLQVGTFVIDELEFSDLILGGSQEGENVSFEFISEDLTGEIRLPASGLMEIDLEHLRLPTDDSVIEQIVGGVNIVQTPDPISVEVGYQLPEAEVSLDLLHLDEEPFGSWHFTIRPEGDLVRFDQFSADVNGVHIADAAIQWDLAANTSAFKGAVKLDDLSTTLPLWDYAPVIQTGSAGLKADARWSGSPAHVSLIGLSGDLAFNARDGRFLDVEGGGGLRVMSLLNFSNIAKRVSLDFRDVTDKGVGFSKINAAVKLDEGRMQFIERMTVESTSSNFQVGGQVNLHTGDLNNEMIVTLPVSDSLPWYGVYLALANPLAGLGVLVGERVLRKPIQAFSTAKFEVKGTLDEPEVKFVSLWDQSMSKPEKNSEQASATVNAEDESLVPSEVN